MIKLFLDSATNSYNVKRTDHAANSLALCSIFKTYPNIEIHGYHASHIPAGDGSHILFTIVKYTIPYEKAPK